MRPRAELALAMSLLAVAGAIAAALGARRSATTDADRRRSTYLAGPNGALAFAQALTRLGVRVERVRRPLRELAAPGRKPSGLTSVLAVLGPTEPLSVREARFLVGASGDLLLAGRTTVAATRCLGYRVRAVEPRALRGPAALGGLGTAMTRAVLVATGKTGVADSSEPGGAAAAENANQSCRSTAPIQIDTVLHAAGGLPAAVRLTWAGGREATIVADDRLFSNRALRETAAGPIALGLIVPRYRRVVVDEYHHGFTTSASLGGAVVAWSARSPWGWAVWQLVLVGLIALCAGAVRFGPVRAGLERRRRSPLEHVRALATALAAARGHGVAGALLVQGLRRRLAPPRRVPRTDPEAWLESLAPGIRTDRGRRALDTLRQTTGRQTDAEGVRRAAHAVEDLWEDLRPS